MAKILVIDDEQGILNYFQKLLTSLGYAVETANDSASGREKSKDPSVNLIISDLSMPGQPNKMELIKCLREARPDCPLIVVSGYPTSERLAACQALGVSEFLTKPFEISFINSILQRLLPLEKT